MCFFHTDLKLEDYLHIKIEMKISESLFVKRHSGSSRKYCFTKSATSYACNSSKLMFSEMGYKRVIEKIQKQYDYNKQHKTKDKFANILLRLLILSPVYGHHINRPFSSSSHSATVLFMTLLTLCMLGKQFQQTSF